MACSEDMTRILSIPFLGLGCVEAFPPRRHCFRPCTTALRAAADQPFYSHQTLVGVAASGHPRLNKFFRLRCLTSFAQNLLRAGYTVTHAERCRCGSCVLALAAAVAAVPRHIQDARAPSRSRLCVVCVCACPKARAVMYHMLMD